MPLEIRHTDIIGSALWLLLAGAVFVVSAGFPAGPSLTSPALYPRVIAGLIAFFALVQLGRTIYTDTQRSHELTAAATKQVVGAVLLVVAYVFLLPWLGFVTATVLFLVAGMLYSGARSPLWIGSIALGLTLLLYYIFAVFLRIPLPESPLLPVEQLLPVLTGVGF